MKSCCIAIMTYKQKLEGDEERSLLRALEVFKNRDIKLVIPNNILTDYYDKLKEFYKFEYEKVNWQWMMSNRDYNKTCCSNEFYQLFKIYDYILIYQTDCWVFEDRIDEFMKLGYDWYGAPWPHHNDTIGNGGFSLRKVSKMLEITSKYKYKGDSLLGNEDTWFCQTHINDLNTCDLKTACNFSIEFLTKKYKDLIETVPMGMHGNFNKQYWK